MPTEDARVRATRLFDLKNLLLSYPGRRWRTREVADSLGVSVDTATRDLEHLSANGTLMLVREGSTAAVTWRVSPDSRAKLPPLQLNYAQGTALFAAARLLSQQQGERNDAVRSAILQLIGVLPVPLRPHMEAVVTDLEPRANTRRNVSPNFAALSEGWLSRRVVRVTYEPPRKSPFECLFSPYLLEPSGIGYTIYFLGEARFLGKNPPAPGLRWFKLERVQDAQLKDEPFEVPADFDGPALLRRSWGVMYGEGDPVHIKLRFSPFVSKRVRETRWHPSEQLTETAEGLVWEADIGDVTEIRPWIRGWGADCEVLEPEALQKEMEREVRRLMRVYRVTRIAETTAGPDRSLVDDLFGEE